MRRKKGHGIRVSFIIITATSLLLTLTMLAYYLLQYRDSDLLNDKIAEIAFGDEGNGGNNAGSQRPKGAVDHAALLEVNGDYVGWIIVDGTDISLPVVQSKQELFYLRRDFYKNKSIAGTVFMDYRNNKQFTDTNTMIYGHNMQNGSMFEPLKRFLKSEFYDKNRYISVSTLKGDFRYEIFAAYEVNASSVPNMPGMLTGEERVVLLDKIRLLSLFEKDFSVDGEDKVLTLATCGYSVKNARIVIHAKLIEN